jgi:hypothetical protein
MIKKLSSIKKKTPHQIHKPGNLGYPGKPANHVNLIKRLNKKKKIYIKFNYINVFFLTI